MPSSDLLSYRREFPVLETGIYLNSNSTGALPRSATEALADLGTLFGTWRDEIWKERFLSLIHI